MIMEKRGLMKDKRGLMKDKRGLELAINTIVVLVLALCCWQLLFCFLLVQVQVFLVR